MVTKGLKYNAIDDVTHICPRKMVEYFECEKAWISFIGVIYTDSVVCIDSFGLRTVHIS